MRRPFRALTLLGWAVLAIIAALLVGITTLAALGWLLTH